MILRWLELSLSLDPLSSVLESKLMKIRCLDPSLPTTWALPLLWEVAILD
jgi:hypothetical protein